MKRVLMSCATALSLIVLSAPSLTADVRTRERTAIKFEGMLGRVVGMFGGRAAREGIVSTTTVKGNRKATMTDTTGQIIDLSEEKVYDLDLKRRTYKVTTFDDLRRQMREAREKAEKDAKREGARDEPAQQPGAEVDVDFDVKETGARKQIAGYDARQVIMTLSVRPKGQTLEDGGGMVLTSDAWFGPEIAALNEVMDFDMRYWKQLEGPEAVGMSAEQLAMVLAMYPMLGQAMERLKQEGTKLEGTVLAQTMTFDAVRSKAQMSEQQQAQGGGAGGGIGGMLARRIKKDDGGGSPRSTIFAVDHELQEVATSVDPTSLAIPDGFKQRK
ncbi:MAG: hypothetical protein H0X67_19885 [Acidobacteria bacterium]|nr:hypothetical protein [Acidobacteriota bacterium]